MRGVTTLCCAMALAEMAQAQERLEFSGLVSPCDEAATDQEDLLTSMDAINEDLEDQIDALWTRVNNELLTYGDTTNVCLSTFCAVGGGQQNTVDADADFGFIRGGKANWCLSSSYCSILGGQANVATGDYCSIGGGIKNKCYSNYGTVHGGYLNAASARFATVAGGSKNTASGRYALASGFQAIASGDYSATFNLLGADTTCENAGDQSVKVCADSFSLNGVDYSSSLATSRLLQEDVTDCSKEADVEASDKRLDVLSQIVTLITGELSASQ